MPFSILGGCDYPVNMSRYVSFGNENELAINRVLAKELLGPCSIEFIKNTRFPPVVTLDQ